jgi:CRP/FNR family transcriptional regulator, cyclic AMP receptor protein
MTNEQFLKSVTLFEALADEELAEVARSVEEQPFSKDSVIVKEGSEGDCLYLVKSGSVRVEKQRDGKALVLAELGAGAFFGEMSLILEGVPHSATVSANGKCEILLIRRLDLEIILNWNTVLGMRIWQTFARVLAQRLRETNDRILEQMLAAENTAKFKMWGDVLKKP